jgi:hypothetical protein
MSPAKIAPSIVDKQTTAERRIAVFKVLTILSLVATGVVCATLGYVLLQEAEYRRFESDFQSTALSMSSAITSGVESRVAAGQSLAGTIGAYCPHAENWPKCWVQYDLWVRATGPVAVNLNMRLTGTMPIVYPHELASFEEWARQVFRNESFHPMTGVKSFGFGVYARNASGFVYHDVNGTNPFSNFTLLTPSLQANKDIWPGFMFNSHSVPARSVAIDKILECCMYLNNTNQSLSSATNLLQLVLDNVQRPSTIIFNAIYLQHSPSKLVGFVNVVINWDTIITKAMLNKEFNSVIVIESETMKASYALSDRKVAFLGNHEDKDDYQGISHRFVIYPDGNTDSVHYVVTFYATKKEYNDYTTNVPIYVCMSSLLIVIFTSLIFLAYDFLVRREAVEQVNLLAAKKKYVRFISHVSSMII